MSADDAAAAAKDPRAGDCEDDEEEDFDDGNHPDYDTLEKHLAELKETVHSARADFEEGEWKNLAAFAEMIIKEARKMRKTALPYRVSLKDQEAEYLKQQKDREAAKA